MEQYQKGSRKFRHSAKPCNSRGNTELPEQYQLTVNGQRFMILDGGIGDHERMFIFASELGLQCLAESENWYADGTFKVSPELFFQLYTIHGQQPGSIFPCVFGLLPNKTEVTYTRFFREVFGQINEPAVTDILVDFERRAINAIRNANQDIEVKGCFFHLCSNVWKRIQHLGLQQRYNDDQEFSLHLRMLCALAFLPPDDVVQGFEDLTDHIRINYQGEVDNLLEYFEDTYIGRHRRNAPRRTAMFPVVLWNMFHRTDEEIPRTNNSVEGWHRSFHARVSSCHPIFWKFLQILQNEENYIRVKIIQNEVWHPAEPQRRILAIADDFPNRETLPYLRSITHNHRF